VVSDRAAMKPRAASADDLLRVARGSEPQVAPGFSPAGATASWGRFSPGSPLTSQRRRSEASVGNSEARRPAAGVAPSEWSPPGLCLMLVSATTRFPSLALRSPVSGNAAYKKCFLAIGESRLGKLRGRTRRRGGGRA
jgi:hypothetical protein